MSIAPYTKIRFGDKCALMLDNESNLKKHIQNQLENLWGLPIVEKNYYLLTPKLMPKLKRYPHLVCPHAIGKKYFLFMTTFGDKNYSTFIYRADGNVLAVRLFFKPNVFKNTLLIGEMVRNKEGKWIYLIDDVYVHHNEDIRNFSFIKRYELLEQLVKNDYRTDHQSPVEIRFKEYYEYSYLEDLIENHIPSMGYPCNGVIFKNLGENLRGTKHLVGILYEVPELKEKMGITNKKNKETNKNGTSEDSVKISITNTSKLPEVANAYSSSNSSILEFLKKNPSSNFSSTNINIDETKKTPSASKSIKENKTNKKDRSHVYLMVKNDTTYPDIYNGYSNNGINVGTLIVRTLKKSSSMRILLKDNENGVIMKCKFHDKFNKWEPICQAKNSREVDDIKTIQNICKK